MPARLAHAVADTWRHLGFEQRAAAIAALLLIVSTFGPFSFVEGAILLIGVAVLVLLRSRARGREFHVPFGDGAVIAAAGAWSAVLILVRLLNRPLGQGLLALACAALLVLAGLRERARRLPDDLLENPEAHQRGPGTGAEDTAPPTPKRGRRRRRGGAAEATEPLFDDATTEPLAAEPAPPFAAPDEIAEPPEFVPPARRRPRPWR